MNLTITLNKTKILKRNMKAMLKIKDANLYRHDLAYVPNINLSISSYAQELATYYLSQPIF